MSKRNMGGLIDQPHGGSLFETHTVVHGEYAGPWCEHVAGIGPVGKKGADPVTQRDALDASPNLHAAMAGAKNPYGDGHAAERIVRAILDF